MGPGRSGGRTSREPSRVAHSIRGSDRTADGDEGSRSRSSEWAGQGRPARTFRSRGVRDDARTDRPFAIAARPIGAGRADCDRGRVRLPARRIRTGHGRPESRGGWSRMDSASFPTSGQGHRSRRSRCTREHPGGAMTGLGDPVGGQPATPLPRSARHVPACTLPTRAVHPTVYCAIFHGRARLNVLTQRDSDRALIRSGQVWRGVVERQTVGLRFVGGAAAGNDRSPDYDLPAAGRMVPTTVGFSSVNCWPI